MFNQAGRKTQNPGQALHLSTADHPLVGYQPWLNIGSARWLRFGSARTSRAPTGRRPTARPNASSSRHCASGPTTSSTRARPSAPLTSTPGSTTATDIARKTRHRRPRTHVQTQSLCEQPLDASQLVGVHRSDHRRTRHLIAPPVLSVGASNRMLRSRVGFVHTQLDITTH